MVLVVPIFIVEEGCPHRCLFCNQHSITGQKTVAVVGPGDVDETIRKWLGWSMGRRSVQVAFYGGSFSCLSQSRQGQLLAAVEPFLASGQVDSIRISTRPDCLSEKVCRSLYGRGVRTVELGCQSMDDKVLEITRRGHNVEQSIVAAELLRKNGMQLGIQLMVGLPGETSRSFLAGVREVIRLRPSFVRLYPALVVENTGLALMYERGEYRPLSMNRAVALCSRASDMFIGAGVRVIRVGLQPSESLERTIVKGPYSPAFGEQVMARSWFKRARKILSTCPAGKTMKFKISDRDLSSFVGPKRINMQRLEQLGLLERLDLETEKKLERGTLLYDFG